jgi:hypothetical protein
MDQFWPTFEWTWWRRTNILEGGVRIRSPSTRTFFAGVRVRRNVRLYGDGRGPASTATGSLLGKYSLAATCRQALDKRDQWLLWQRENGVVPPLIGHTSVGSAVKSSLCWQTLAKRVGPNIPRYASIRPTQLGSCVDLVPVHEDSAFVLRVFTRGDNERLSYAIE